MKIVVIDGQGGGMGRALVEGIKKAKGVLPKDTIIIAVGTNATAAAHMLRGGADISVSGENAVIVNARDAAYILGPIGILVADAMYGELSANMAHAISISGAEKILIPVNKCRTKIVGVIENTLSGYIEEAVAALCQLAGNNDSI